jgi:hypothetical protein
VGAGAGSGGGKAAAQPPENGCFRARRLALAVALPPNAARRDPLVPPPPLGRRLLVSGCGQGVGRHAPVANLQSDLPKLRSAPRSDKHASLREAHPQAPEPGGGPARRTGS